MAAPRDLIINRAEQSVSGQGVRDPYDSIGRPRRNELDIVNHMGFSFRTINQFHTHKMVGPSARRLAYVDIKLEVSV